MKVKIQNSPISDQMWYQSGAEKKEASSITEIPLGTSNWVNKSFELDEILFKRLDQIGRTLSSNFQLFAQNTAWKLLLQGCKYIYNALVFWKMLSFYNLTYLTVIVTKSRKSLLHKDTYLFIRIKSTLYIKFLWNNWLDRQHTDNCQRVDIQHTDSQQCKQIAN